MNATTAAPIWGEFQSLMQLSIALNAGYAAFSTFTGRVFVHANQRLRRLIGLSERISRTHQDNCDINLTSQLRLLDGECHAISRLHDRMLDKRLRPICIAFAISGLILLICSSYFYSDTIHLALQALVLASLAPFALVCMSYCIVMWRYHYRVFLPSLRIEHLIEEENNSLSQERGQ